MILISGATGTNGVELIHQLCNHGERVRALTRHPEKAEKMFPHEVEITRGDLDDPESLSAAMDGINKVFLLCSVDERQIELEENMLEAAQSANVSMLVKFSVLHADANSKCRLLHYHGMTEASIRSLDLPYTILRPNMFMQELLRQTKSIKTQGAFYFPFPAEVRISLVDVRDNAAVAAKVLTEHGNEGKTFDITGPAAVSFAEMADALSNVLGTRVNYVPVTMQQWKQAFAATGASPWLVDTVADLYQTYVPANSVLGDGVHLVTGKLPRSLDEFLRDNISQFKN